MFIIIFKIVQFLQIQNVLESAGEEGQNDLVKLRNDLAELIHVSEGTFLSFIVIISNRNWTKWSTSHGVIRRVISKSAERKARG